MASDIAMPFDLEIPEMARGGLSGWASMAGLVASTVLGALVLSQVALFLARRAVGRTRVAWDDALLASLAAPVRMAFLVGATRIALLRVGIPDRMLEAIGMVLHAGFLMALLWGLYRSVGVFRRVAQESPWAKGNPGSVALIALGGRVAQLGVVTVTAIAVLSTFGLPVASLIAGVGFGGIALGLAAQKTVENLFGGFSLAVDQPCRAGDFVRIDDLVGTVEAVGVRSTRIRTLDRRVALRCARCSRHSSGSCETILASGRIPSSSDSVRSVNPHST
jgi:MscS family membrane protein